MISIRFLHCYSLICALFLYSIYSDIDNVIIVCFCVWQEAPFVGLSLIGTVNDSMAFFAQPCK